MQGRTAAHQNKQPRIAIMDDLEIPVPPLHKMNLIHHQHHPIRDLPQGLPHDLCLQNFHHIQQRCADGLKHIALKGPDPPGVVPVDILQSLPQQHGFPHPPESDEGHHPGEKPLPEEPSGKTLQQNINVSFRIFPPLWIFSL